MIATQEKNEQAVFVPLPPAVIDLVRKLPPKSPQFFFWPGTSTIKTAVNDWSEKMRRLYVEAGIEGKRTHEWRDTLAIECLRGAGRSKTCNCCSATNLGKRRRSTTSR
jgi:integrase